MKDDPTAISWWRCSGDKTYAMNPQTFFTKRCYHALAIRVRPFYHRHLYFSRITGEQVSYEAILPVKA
ncbi:MAG: hypothetical protein WC749_02030 [Dehalococcoidia bacterium]